MSSGGGGASPLSNLTDLILVANAGNSSFVVNTDSTPSLYVDSNANVGINTLEPASKFEVNSASGECITVRHDGSETAYGSINVSSNGNVAINTNGQKITTNKSLDIVGHNGSTTGLMLGGSVVEATAEELNRLAGVSAGSVVAGKAIVANEAKTLSGLTSISATELSGTIQTAAQPNITSLGTLTSLNISGTFSAAQLSGTLQTAAQPNITSVGTLSDLTVSGGVSAAQLTGTLQTAAQPNITSVGDLSSLTVSGTTVSNELEYLEGVIAGTASASKAVVLDADKEITGITGLSATSLTGTLQTAAQPNITSVGTLTSLSVGGGVSASTLSGTLQTAAQPNITSVGNLSTVSIGGSTIGSEAAFLSGATAGSAAASKALVLSAGKAITGITSLSATQLSGTLQTAAQPNITSLGNLSSLSVGGFSIGTEAAYLSGATPGTAANSKVLVLNGSGAISGISSLSATSLSGTLQTAAQPNIASVGTLSSLAVSGSVNLTSGTDAVNTLSGALKVAGGMSVVKNMFVGGIIDAAGFRINGTPISSGGSGGSVSLPSYVSDATAGTATASKVLVLDSSSNVSGIGSLSATSLTGTLQTAAQPNITSVGTLSGLSVSGAGSFDSLTVNGVAITGSGGGGGGGSASLPSYIADITEGTAAASKAVVLDSSKNVSGINQVSTSTAIVTSTTNSSSYDTGALTVAGGVGIAGNIFINGLLTRRAPIWVRYTSNVSSQQFVIPENIRLVRVYVGGKGGNGFFGIGSGVSVGCGGGGGGFAFGSIITTPGSSINITITNSNSIVTYNDITFTANAGGNATSNTKGTGGTAIITKTSSSIIDSGFYTGGSGGAGPGGGGGSCASPLGNGYDGGIGLGGGGGGIGGSGGTSGGGGGGAGGGTTSTGGGGAGGNGGHSLTPDIGGPGRSFIENKFIDPLLELAISPGLNANTIGVAGTGGGGGGCFASTQRMAGNGGAFGGGGGAWANSTVSAQQMIYGGFGGLMGGGGGASNSASSGPAYPKCGNGGLGGGGGGGSRGSGTTGIGSETGGVGGNGFVFLYY